MSAMTRYVLTASIVCAVVVLAAFVSLSEAQQQGAGETCDNDADCARSRHRRSPCSGSTYTMSRLIEIIEQLEKNVKGQTAQDYIRYLRKFIYANSSFLSRQQWDYACGQLTSRSMPNDALTEEEREDLAQMIIHGNTKKGQEKGVVWTKHSDTVAAGHVVTGISCGGFNRDTQLDIAKWLSGASSSLDNLFFVTISGDMGQTSLQFSSDKKTRRLFGPAGQWNDSSCPKEYTLPSPVSELTDAEVRGDMDGVILGTLIPMIKGRGWKLSRIFHDYYQNGGIQVGPRQYSATNRNERFGELVSDVELEAQSKAFAEAYYKPDRKLYKGRSLQSLLPDIPNAIQQFYKDYVPCNEELKKKYTIQYFIKLVKELEAEKNLGLYEMTQAIVGVSEYFTSSYFGAMLDVDDHGHKYTDHFAWYVLRELVSHGFSPSTPRRELGVIEAGGDVVAIGHVLAGIHAGVGRTSLYGATVAGSLARAAVNREAASKKTLDTMGATGTWDRSNCPVIKYMLKRNIKSAQHTTRAELLGDIDGFVLGHRVPDWLRTESRLKLSTALERYYGKDFNPVSGQVRFEQLKTYIDKSKLITETTIACTKIKKKNANWYQQSDTSFCKAAAEGAVTKFYKTVFLSKDEAKTSYESQMLPDYKTLVAAYPGDKAEGGVISGSDLRSQLAGSRSIDRSQAAVDSLRISVMFNKLFGHRIPKTQSHKSVISEGRVYIYDLATLKGYLTEKYGGPVAELSGKSGILMVERPDGRGVSVGLWDGTKMHQMAHRSRQATDKVYLWKANGCSTQLDGGSCQFYQCINWAAPCGTSGYVLGYGFRYCRQFHSLYNKFDKEGQLWTDDVRTCLMQEVESLYKRRFSCDQFKRSAIDSHAGCYENSKHFCKMASAAKNRDVLFDIFEPDNLWDFWGYTAWTQVLDTLKHCKKHVSRSVMNDIINFIKQARKKMQQSLSSKQQDEGAKTSSVDPDDSSTCVAYANAGDCRFYQCFQQKFPCSVFDASHVTDFEFPLCEDLQNQNLMLNYGGEQWLKKTNKCLMAKLLSLYHETSVSCVDLHSVMFDGRADCLVDAGFCDVLTSKRNSFAVDTGTNLWSYPSLLPDKPGLTLAGRDYFYSELSSLRRLMGHIGKACG